MLPEGKVEVQISYPHRQIRQWYAFADLSDGAVVVETEVNDSDSYFLCQLPIDYPFDHPVVIAEGGPTVRPPAWLLMKLSSALGDLWKKIPTFRVSLAQRNAPQPGIFIPGDLLKPQSVCEPLQLGLCMLRVGFLLVR